MKTKLFNIFSVLMIVAMLAMPASALAKAPAPNTEPAAQPEQVQGTAVDEQTPQIYLIRLKDAPLATYKGDVPGLAATSVEVTGERKLDVHSVSSQRYLNYLASVQSEFISTMDTLLGRNVEVVYQYQIANNGLAVKLTPAEAEAVAALPGVIFMQPDFQREPQTDMSVDYLGAPGIWDGSQTGGLPGTMGEGMIIGVIDTGITPNNPSFAAVGPVDGYVHTNPFGSGNYVGVCDPANPYYDSTFPCNDKLIGAYGYAGHSGEARDYHGHGSHTSSTAAGNIVNITDPVTATISGMAPHANIISYASCCNGSDLSASIDDAIADGVDVINYSIGSTSPSDVWNDFDTVGYLNARAAGIFVATSAGNAGPGAETVGSPADAPWLTSVGNNQHIRVYANAGDVTGPTPVPPELTNLAVVNGEGSPVITSTIESNITWAGDVDPGNETGCNAFPAGVFTGDIALIQRGGCTFATKETNAANAGAIAMIVFNHSGGMPIVMGGMNGTIPSFFMAKSDGEAVVAWIQAHPGAATFRINPGYALTINPVWPNIIAPSSSRGANRALPGIIKPDVTAFGTSVLAALATGDDVGWGFMSGTSMASPHVAGAAALLMSLHPDWTPAEVQSALMTTAWTDMLKEDGSTPADPFDIGSGRIQMAPAAQAALVMDETYDNYMAANPDNGGDPKSLNIPSLGNGSCVGTCTWERTVRSTLALPQDWAVILNAPPTITLSASPMNFTLNPGMTQTLVITADVMGAPLDVWQFAEVVITPVITMSPQPAAATIPVSAAPASEDGAETMNAPESVTAPVAPLATIFGPEGFEGTFPPTGWMTATTGATDDPGWVATAARVHSGSYAAYHNDDSTTGDAISWLVMPSVTLPSASTLVFWQNQNYDGYYIYHGVWVSTGDCDPANGAFVELTELGVGTEDTWEEKRVDLSAYGGQTVCLAFRYEGDFADEWYIDDVSINTAEPNLGGSEMFAPGLAEFGDVVTYTIVISNSGNLTATNAWMVDPLPASATLLAGPICSDGTCGYDAATSEITWTGAVSIADVALIEFTAELTGTCGDVITNTAVISDPLISGPVTVTAVTQIVNSAYLGEDFEGVFPPAGWTITATNGTTMTWARNDTFGVPNMTAYGSGYSAAADAYGSGVAWDTELHSPEIPLAERQNIQLSFASNFQDYAGNGDAYLDISTDGGMTWNNLFHKTNDDPSGGTMEVWDLSAYAGMTATLRWRYTATSSTAWFWHIDDVKLAGCDIPDVAYVPPAHLPVAVRPTGSSLPDLVEIVTDQYTGTQTISDIQVLSTVTDLSSVVFGLERADLTEDYLSQDPTNGDPFDNLDDVLWFTVDVPTDALRLVAEIVKTDIPDADLFVGIGDTPSMATLVAYSASGGSMEYVNVDSPPAGTWWVLVQSWQGSAEQPDRVLVASAAVPNVDNGNMTISGPTAIPSGQPFDLDVTWDESSMVGFDRWYGAFNLGTDAANPDNLGLVRVDLEFVGARVSKSAPATAVSGDTIGYTITLDTPTPISGTAVISDVLPAGVSIITSTITSTFGTAWYDATDNAVYWSKTTSIAAPVAAGPLPGTSERTSRPVALVADSMPSGAGVTASAPLVPAGTAMELVLDDGSAENNIGIGGTAEFVFLNYFSPNAAFFPFDLNEVQVYFSGGTTGVQVGDDIAIVVYQDDDGDPSNGATWLASYPTTVQAVDDWNVYPLATPVHFDNPTNVFIGVLALEVPGSAYFPAALDATASQGRSWAGWWSTSPPPDPPTLPPDDTWMLIDGFLPGNWLIRGYGESLVPDTVFINFDVTVSGDPGDVITNTAEMAYNGAAGMASASTTIVISGHSIYLPLIMK